MALTLASAQTLLSYAGSIAAAILLVCLWRRGLWSRYRFFAIYLACLACELFILIGIEAGTPEYFYAFAVVESLQWIAQILIILELFSLVLRGYPAIASSGRNFAAVAFLVAFALSLGLAVLNHQTGGEYPILQKYMLVARVMAFALLAFFLLILGFLLWFPIPLSRNVVAYSVGYSVYFASRALTRLAANLAGSDYFSLLSCLSLAIVPICLLYWVFSLTRRGEAVDMTLGHRWQPAQAPLLVQQLESINTALLRTARR